MVGGFLITKYVLNLLIRRKASSCAMSFHQISI